MIFRIKEARQNAGYSQKELAEIIGVAPNTFHGYESGKHDPKSDLLTKIAKACHVTVDFLLGFEGDFPRNKKNASSLSDEARELANTYDNKLDIWGKKQIRDVLNNELARCQNEREKLKVQEMNEENLIQFHMPGYYQSVSAGAGDWNDDDSWEDLLLTKRPPKGVAYVVRVNGDSMEPTFHNGDRLFIRPQDTLEDGQIGIFVMDSCMYVKELRKGFLVSHNPEYDPIPLNENARCQGRVLGVCDESYVEK